MPNLFDSLFRVRLGFVLRSFIMVFIIVILLQDFFVFPQVNEDLFFREDWSKEAIPSGIRASMLETYDGKSVEMWRMERVEGTAPLGVALLLHGDSGRLISNLNFMKALSGLGFDTYQIDYRGFGYSTGWPSTTKIKKDIDAAVAYIANAENVSSEEITPFGISLGTGFAAYAASRYKTRSLVLVSPFTDLRDIVTSGPIMYWLRFFMWNDLPTIKWIQSLSNTCVVAVHGTSDPMIPYVESLKLKENYQGSKTYTLITQEGGGHVGAYWAKEQEIGDAITRCVLAR